MESLAVVVTIALTQIIAICPPPIPKCNGRIANAPIADAQTANAQIFPK